VQPIVEKIADRLPGWKADLLTKAGRNILVQAVLTSMLVYLLLALDLPTKALEAIDKIRRGFLWKGRKDVRGGHCLIAWSKVARPPNLGGLGISHLQFMGWALRLRWLWLQKTEPDKPWAFLPVQAPPQVKALFAIAITTVIGNGKNTYFWTDRWLVGQRLDQTCGGAKNASNLRERTVFGAVAARAKKRTVHDALEDNRWISDIKGALTVNVLIEYLHLWESLSGIELQT
jgi:hypothetical protein